MQSEIQKIRNELDHVIAELKIHKSKIIKLEQLHKPGRKLIKGLEEPCDRTSKCDCSICHMAEEIHLRLKNEKSCFMFLAECIDYQMWSALKRFVECTIKENFKRSPEPRRKKVNCTADRTHEENQTCKENETAKELMVTLDNKETETDYEDYSDLDPILPPEESPQVVPTQHIIRIPRLEDIN